MNKKVVANVAIFVFVVIISGWLGVLADSVVTEQPEGDSLGMGIWLLMPNLAAILLVLFSKISFRELGFKPNFR